MSTHICTECGHEEAIFGSGGAQKMADDFNLDLLGSIPLELSVRQYADAGNPTVAAEPESAMAVRYREIALKIAGINTLWGRGIARLFLKNQNLRF